MQIKIHRIVFFGQNHDTMMIEIIYIFIIERKPNILRTPDLWSNSYNTDDKKTPHFYFLEKISKLLWLTLFIPLVESNVRVPHMGSQFDSLSLYIFRLEKCFLISKTPSMIDLFLTEGRTDGRTDGRMGVNSLKFAQL